MPEDNLLNKRIPELTAVMSAAGHFQMVVYSPDADATYRIDVSKLMQAEAAAFEGYIIYAYTGASGAAQTFTHDKVMVESGGTLYKLVHAARPYGSTDLAAEVAAGHWVAIGGGGSGSGYLNDLLDVNITSAANGQVLYRSGVNWINRTLTASDVGALTQTIADNLYQPIGNYSLDGHTHSMTLNDLTNVDTAGITVGQVLQWNGSSWVNGNATAAGGGAESLNELTDVLLGSPAAGQVLQYNGSNWVNATPVEGYLPLTFPEAYTINMGAHQLSFQGSVAAGRTFDMEVNQLQNGSFYINTTSALGSSRLGVFPSGGSSLGLAAMGYLGASYSSGTNPHSALFSVAANTDGSAAEINIEYGGASSRYSFKTDGIYLNGALYAGSGGGSGATTLDGLTDVVITSPTNGQFLTYNGTNWVNTALSGAYIQTNQTSDQTVTMSGNSIFHFKYPTFQVSTAMVQDRLDDLQIGAHGFQSNVSHIWTGLNEEGSTFIGDYQKVGIVGGQQRITRSEFRIYKTNNTGSKWANFSVGVGVNGSASEISMYTDGNQLVKLTPTGFFLNDDRILTEADLGSINSVTLSGDQTITGVKTFQAATETGLAAVFRNAVTSRLISVDGDATLSFQDGSSAVGYISYDGGILYIGDVGYTGAITHFRGDVVFEGAVSGIDAKSKTPVALVNNTTVNFNLSNNYNFTWAISAGNKTLNPTNHASGDNWAIDITNCQGQTITLGPTSGYSHRVAGTTGTVTTITLPTGGKTITLLGRRIGSEIRWAIQEF